MPARHISHDRESDRYFAVDALVHHGFGRNPTQKFRIWRIEIPNRLDRTSEPEQHLDEAIKVLSHYLSINDLDPTTVAYKFGQSRLGYQKTVTLDKIAATIKSKTSCPTHDA